MAGNGQHNPWSNYNDEDLTGDNLGELFLEMVMPPIMGGGGSQTYPPGSTQVQHDLYSIQDIQAGNFQYHGNPLAQSFQTEASLAHPNAQSPLDFPAASALPYGNPQLTPAFQTGSDSIQMYTEPNQSTVGPVPIDEGLHLDPGFLRETTHRQPTSIHPRPNYLTGTLNPPQAQYPGVPPRSTTYQPLGDSPSPNNFTTPNPFKAQLNNQGGTNTIPHREQYIKVFRILGELLRSNGTSFDPSSWTNLATELRATWLVANEMVRHSPGSGQNVNVADGRFRCLLCKLNDRRAFKNRGTFRRHVRDQHFPDFLYSCGTCYPPAKAEFRRKDKLHEHMRNVHSVQKLTKEQLVAFTTHLDPPLGCAICNMPVRTWDDFFECLCRHCSISEADRNQGGSPDDDGSDGDDDSGDNGGHGGHGGAGNSHGNGHQHFYANGSGNSGNMGNSGQSHQFGGYLFENSGAGSGAGSFRNCDASDVKIIPSNQADSQKSAFENTATTSNRPEIPQPTTIVPTAKLQKESKFDSPRLRVDEYTHVLETFNTELALRLNRPNWEGYGDLGKQNGEGRLVCDKQSASVPVNDKIQQEFRRLRFFEGVLYENQKQGTFLSYFHETLVISAPARPIALLMRDISYLKVELRSEKPLEIPGDHLFYLARGKDNGTSEANLEMTRRASKRRAHLKVRIRAIAGVLALRAAVSKTPAATDENSEVGHEVGHEANDGWELGVPLPSHASQEEVMKILTYLIQMLVFLLRMHQIPEISVMLTDDSFGVSQLT